MNCMRFGFKSIFFVGCIIKGIWYFCCYIYIGSCFCCGIYYIRVIVCVFDIFLWVWCKYVFLCIIVFRWCSWKIKSMICFCVFGGKFVCIFGFFGVKSSVLWVFDISCIINVRFSWYSWNVRCNFIICFFCFNWLSVCDGIGCWFIICCWCW